MVWTAIVNISIVRKEKDRLPGETLQEPRLTTEAPTGKKEYQGCGRKRPTAKKTIVGTVDCQAVKTVSAGSCFLLGYSDNGCTDRQVSKQIGFDVRPNTTILFFLMATKKQTLRGAYCLASYM